MEAKLQRRIQRYGWDKAAAYYEDAWREQLRPAQDRMLELAAPKPGERVLDVACGTGLVTFRAAKAVEPGGSVYGTDISESMVEQARRLMAARNVENCDFDRMDAEDLSAIADASFDAALCGLGLMYVPDPVQALREQHRVLKPGGRAAAAVWGQRDRCAWAEIFPITDARVQSEVCPMFFQTGTKDVLALSMKQAGFSDIRLERLDVTLSYASGEELLGAMFLGGPVALAYSKFDEATREAVHSEFLESVAAHRTGEGYAIPGEFVVAVGYKR
jgi:ubiquinone/menaquinone biosynthesis C-methylase UbiE